MKISIHPNVDLTVLDGNMTFWSQANERRRGWHQLHNLARYCTSFRAAQVMKLQKRMDLRIAELDGVQRLTSLPWFSAMVVVQGQHIVFERYAADFAADRVHSIQSISKTMINLMVGQLVERGVLDLSRQVRYYIPEAGSGYAAAHLQQVLNMDVANEYFQDFANPRSTYFRHEEAMGWRLPLIAEEEETEHQFLSKVVGSDLINHSGHAQYKDANTAMLGWIVERASRRPLRAFIADIVDAAGIEGTFHITTDREGVPTLEGGVCTTARDLARYLSIFLRRGTGVTGKKVGSDVFIDQTLAGGVPMPSPLNALKYSNHLMTAGGDTLGHGGWGGQYAMVNLRTGRIGVFFSVIENEHANNQDYLGPVVNMLETVLAI